MTLRPLDWSFVWAVLIFGLSSCGTLVAISLNKRRHRATAVVVIFVVGVLGGFTASELIRGLRG